MYYAVKLLYTNNLEHKYVPSNIHIASIVFAPLYITHRIALQCGDDINNGETKNPYVVEGTQYLVYKWAAA